MFLFYTSVSKTITLKSHSMATVLVHSHKTRQLIFMLKLFFLQHRVSQKLGQHTLYLLINLNLWWQKWMNWFVRKKTVSLTFFFFFFNKLALVNYRMFCVLLSFSFLIHNYCRRIRLIWGNWNKKIELDCFIFIDCVISKDNTVITYKINTLKPLNLFPIPVYNTVVGQIYLNNQKSHGCLDCYENLMHWTSNVLFVWYINFLIFVDAFAWVQTSQITYSQRWL